tara:strand:- start:387 stop:722 length:336 start_codon:yes stop_codon:yes gene_type:complete
MYTIIIQVKLHKYTNEIISIESLKITMNKRQHFKVGDVIILKHLVSVDEDYDNESECIGIVHKVEKEYFIDKKSREYKDKLTILTNAGSIRTASSGFVELYLDSATIHALD